MTPLEKLKYGTEDILTCANKQCPRFGLLTVIYAQLKPKSKAKNGDKKGKHQKV